MSAENKEFIGKIIFGAIGFFAIMAIFASIAPEEIKEKYKRR